jgi:hypothetical protein
MKIFTPLKTLALMAAMLITPQLMFAGDGTKASPYTVAELNAQKDALATSGATVWVKADLKGLGEDGSLTENVENTQMAGLFGDDTGTFVAYSWQILGQLAISDLTNTKDLLISLTYGTTGHPYGNTANPQYASNKEPSEAHFSLEEVHGALSLTITNGCRGYHIASCYIIPKQLVAARVSASSKDGIVYYDYYDGAEEGKTYVLNKNAALVLLGNDGTYDLVLSAGYYEQINSNDLNPGTQAGVNSGTTASRWRLRFVNDGTKIGFERNTDGNCTVTLQSKDEIFLQVSTANNAFKSKHDWETEDEKWISWKGKKISDFHAQATEATFDFTSEELRGYIGTAIGDKNGWFLNETYTVANTSLQITSGSAPSRIFVKNGSGILAMYPQYSTLTFRAPNGYAITKIEFSNKNSTGDAPTLTVGTFSDFVWTGNADGVRFLNSNGTLYLANAVVTLAEKTAETATLGEIEYTEVNTIAAFNALEVGTFAKLTLTDAEVIGKSADDYTTVWIQDATGGCWIQYTSLNTKLQAKTKINGTVYAVRRIADGNNSIMVEAPETPNSSITATNLDDFTSIELTSIGNMASDDTYLGRVVKLSGASFVATSATAGTLTKGEESIKVNNGTQTASKQMHQISDTWTSDVTKLSDVTIMAILVSTGKNKTTYPNQLLPISMTGTPAGISNITADVKAEDAVIYNLSGQRVEHPTKGIYIVNGRKYVIR